MWFWVFFVLFTLISIAGMIGNGLVIYVANRNPQRGALRHLNKVVRNLAITDFLFNVLAAPLIMTYWIIIRTSGEI